MSTISILTQPFILSLRFRSGISSFSLVGVIRIMLVGFKVNRSYGKIHGNFMQLHDIY